ncbi:nSTAND1 domain-containing NTPase [Agromyces sp. SYSU T00266]|uniref:nSTAND1 domain-containing NTPase n=1 Tax=Agromyces zhanjiangensis TaxID=3158562 RepID=UPI003391010B
MTVCVLGPLDTGGPALSPRERTILSALVVRRARSVSPDELADACWGEQPPQTWTQQVQNAIARIRSRLGRDAVLTVAGGYRLGVPDGAIDAVTFEREVSRARRFGLEGAHDRAAAAYGRALDLWRGDPYPDVPDWPPARAEAMRLAEIHADAEEELLDARLRLGEDAAVIPDAERMVRESPLREHRWAVLALANYRAGRQAEAVGVLRSARVRIVEELGLDLGGELRGLEVDILRHDPALEPDAAPAGERPSGVDETCPYRGLAAYDVDDAALFFGRDRDVGAILARVRPRAVVTIVGPSGSGKSSVLRAGVVPRLREIGRQVVVITPDESGLAELRDAVSGDPATLAVDQAEELLELPGDELRELAALIRSWLDAGGSMLLALRSDFLDRASAVPVIGTALGQDVYALAPMAEDGLRLACTGPAEAAGLSLETGLVEVILRDAGNRSAILPALSHALAATWSRRDGATLTLEGYDAVGGIAGAIARSAEQVYGALGTGGREACRSLMMRLVERTPEGATVRRRVPLDTLTGGATRRAVVESLVAARLVTIDRDSAIIAHEAVGRAWPRLDAWLDEDAGDARMLRRTEAAAAAWDAAGRPDDELMRGASLQATVEWRDRTAAGLTSTESDFITASLAAHRDEVRELEERAERERAINRRLRVALAVSAILAVIAVIASGVAVVRSADAEAAAEEVRIEALTSTASSAATDREVAALVAVEIHRRWPEDPRAAIALQGAFGNADGLMRTMRFPDAVSVAAAVVPRTRTALITVDPAAEGGAAGSGPATMILDLTTGEVVRELDVDLPSLGGEAARSVSRSAAPYRQVIVSEDGSTALIHTRRPSSAEPGACCVSDLVGVPLRSSGFALEATTLDVDLRDRPALAPDGRAAYLLLRGAGEPAMVDLATGRLIRPSEAAATSEDATGLQRIAFVDGRVVAGAGDHLRVYDAETLALAGVIDLPVEGNVSMTSLLMASDGTGGLLVMSSDRAARIGVPSGEVRWVRTDLRCGTVLVPPASGFLCSRVDGIWSYDLDTGQPLRRLLEPLESWTSTMDWIAGAAEIVTVTRDPATIRRWRPDGGIAVRDLDAMRDAACALAARQLTRTEWADHFGDEPYRRTCPDAP